MENFIFCAAILQSKCYFAIIQINFNLQQALCSRFLHKENWRMLYG